MGDLNLPDFNWELFVHLVFDTVNCTNTCISKPFVPVINGGSRKLSVESSTIRSTFRKFFNIYFKLVSYFVS